MTPDLPLDEAALKAACEGVAEALSGALDCTRVWEAWSVGTMSEEDFVLVEDDSGRVTEIAEAAIRAYLSALPPSSDEAVEKVATSLVAASPSAGQNGHLRSNPISRAAALDLARAAIAAMPTTEWRPIETAMGRTDLDVILACDAKIQGGWYQVVFWDEKMTNGFNWASQDGPNFRRDAFTHWQKLPAPPSGERK